MSNDGDISSDAETGKARNREAILREQSRPMREEINAMEENTNKIKHLMQRTWMSEQRRDCEKGMKKRWPN